MGETIPKNVKDIWEKWNIRVLIIFSLSLQAILVLFAPSRKRTAGKLFVFLIWLTYLLADWSANYTVGQISDTQEYYAEDGEPSSSSKNHELLAFWAPFLLLHLGGPDTITALALEDNELWRRHLFGLICQAISTVYVLFLSIPSAIVVPTALMIVAGVIKFAERIRALYLASSGKFKGSILRKHEKLKRKENPTVTQQSFSVPIRPNRELRDIEVVQYAYRLFNISKGLVPDLRLASRGWDESKSFFDSMNPEEALRVLEVELSFMYDDFFTKASILLTRVGSVFRFIALGCLVSSLCIFLSKKKNNYDRFDVNLTYALLVGGIVLELFVSLMVCVSDRTIAITRKLKVMRPEETLSWAEIFLNWVLGFRRLKWKRCRCPMGAGSEGHEVMNRTFMFRRWSEYLYGYNLIGFCARKSPKNIHHPKSYIRSFVDLRITRRIDLIAQGIYSYFESTQDGAFTIAMFTGCFRVILSIKCWAIFFSMIPFIILTPFALLLDVILFGMFHLLEFFGIQDEITEMIFKSSNRLPRDLWEFIYKEVRYKSRVAVDQELAKQISSARGRWTLSELLSNNRGEAGVIERLIHYVSSVDYGQSILIWHIATDLIHRTDTRTLTEEEHRCKELSKILSEYMMYLVMIQPNLMSAVAGTAKIRFNETCTVAETFFKDSLVDMSETCHKILSNDKDMVRYRFDTTAMEDAHKLAKELTKLERGSGEGGCIWGVVSRVWVELLCYAANHCESKQHAAHLSKGGEIVSFVWLLMAHLGLGKHNRA